ncbi:MAG: hypothetical protein LBS01_08070 [Prevotellaceae bacterium]|jgi:hypothetical protein|nr:hypothetical protein [Prevotellaceae bacterium]
MKTLKNIFFYLAGAALVMFGTRNAVKSIIAAEPALPSSVQKTDISPFETIRTDSNGDAGGQSAAINDTVIETATPETATATQ